MAKRKINRQPTDDAGGSYPLTAEHCQICRAVGASAAVCRAVIAKCDAAGIDLSAYALVNDEQDALATGVRREFFGE